MAEVESASKLAEILRHPEDLDKLPGLKLEFTRKKAAVDTQLRHGLKEQLALTSAGMNSITDGQRTVNMIKEEMMKIDKLCAEAQNMIQDFPHINLVAQTHRNFEQVEKMKRDIDTFAQRLDNLEYLLGQDDEDPANQPNLLEIHYGLSQLRDIRDEAMEQIKSTEDASTELIDNLALDSGATVSDYFARLDDIIEWFDKHIGEACINLIELVQAGNDGMVVRLALVIEEEEKQDKKAKALQDAQREYKDLALRFKSIATGSKELRGYKEKFLKSIEYVCQANFDDVNVKFDEEPDKIEKHFKWFFNNLNTVKLGMRTLMPRKWHIFRTYCSIYHKQMHDWLAAKIEDDNRTPVHLLAIINWVDKYYSKMQRLEAPEEALTPHIVDNRSAELVRDYRQVIVSAVDDWMDRMAVQDKTNFLKYDPSSYELDADGVLRTKTLGDMWRMLSEQLSVAASSERTDVIEGTVDAMLRALTARQRMWQTLIEGELSKFASGTADSDNAGHMLDWLTAIANDQINCIDDIDEDRPGYLTVFERDIKQLVSPTYSNDTSTTTAFSTLKDGYIQLSIQAVHTFVEIIFHVDFKTVLPRFFTPEWYAQVDMSAISTTYLDYYNEYSRSLHPSLQSILIQELSDELLAHYLASVRNKSAKFKRSDPFTDKIKDDLNTAWRFFETATAQQESSSYDDIRLQWRAVESLVMLISSDKASLPDVYERVKERFWDVTVLWVEAVLRARDDFERAMLSNVKGRAAQIGGGLGTEETIMTRVNRVMSQSGRSGLRF